MFDAGALIFRIQAQGAKVFQRDMSEADEATDKLGKSAQEAADSTEELGNKQDSTSKSTRDSTKSHEKATKSTKDLASAQREVGGVLAGVGAALVATSGLAAKAAIDWESAWTGVEKVVDGTPEQLAAVEDSLRGMARELPASQGEIAAVAEAAGRLGVESESIAGFTRTMIDMGEATDIVAEEAATQLARFMNVMGTSTDDVDRLGSSIVDLGNNFATSESEIVALSSRLAGAGAQIGLTEGDVTGLAAALSAVGVNAEAGGTALSKVMIDIAASVDEGGERLDQFAEVSGLSADEFAKKWKEDPGAALAAFVGGLADAESQGKSTIGILADMDITEQRMRDSLLKAAAASDDFSRAMEMGNAAFEENVALQTEAEKRYATTASRIEIMRNNIVDAAIDMGSVFLPAVQGVTDGISKMSNFIADQPGEVQGLIGALGLGVGAVTLFGGVFLLALPKIAEFRTSLRVLSTEMPRTTKAMRGVTGFLMGPWGVAIGAGIAVLAAFGAAQGDAAARTEAYVDTLEEAPTRSPGRLGKWPRRISWHVSHSCGGNRIRPLTRRRSSGSVWRPSPTQRSAMRMR